MNQIVESVNYLKSVNAGNAMPKLSNKYNFISSKEIIEKFIQHGWTIRNMQEVNTRNLERIGFQKHMIRLRNENVSDIKILGDSIVEAIVINSHDGLSSLNIRAGIYRLVCLNGAIVSENEFSSIRIRHKKLLELNISDITTKFINFVDKIKDKINIWKELILSETEQHEYAVRSLAVRFGNKSPIFPHDVLKIRRTDDSNNNLWTVFNRVQENISKGGLSYIRQRPVEFNGRMHKTGITRSIKNINRYVNVNQELWEVTNKFANELK